MANNATVVTKGGIATGFSDGTPISTASSATPSSQANVTVVKNSNGQATGFSNGVSLSQGPNQTQSPAPAVFSATPAINKINNQIQPVITSGNAGITAQNAKNSIDPAYQMSAAELANPALYTQRIAAYNAAKNGQTTTTPSTDTTTPSPADQAMKDAANTPDAGYQFAYDANGNKQQVQQGMPLAPGLSFAPPADPTKNGHAVVATTTNANGTTYQQYSDGTYGIADMTGAYAGTATAQDFQNAQANDPSVILQQISAKLSSLTVGSVPLTGPQEAQINALQANLASDVASQTQANANFTGATTVAENLYGMGTSLAGIGAIKGTIDAGVAKIADLQNKAAVAIATMTDSFQQENYKDTLDAYNAYTASLAGIQNHIDALQAAAVKAKEDAQSEAHQNFQDQISSQNLTLSQKKEVFDEYMSQANLDETKKKDAEDSYYKQQTLALQQAAANPYQAGGTGPVQLTATGAPSKASQAAFLAQYPPGVQTQITGLANYTLLPTSFPTRAAKGEMDRATAVALAQQYDPTYNENLAASRQKTITAYSDGTSAPSKNITALNTAAGHLATLASAFDSEHNVGSGIANFFINTTGAATGLKSTAGAGLTIAAVTGELATAFKNSGATDAEIESLGTIDVNSSPKAVQDYITTATGLMGSKLGALQDSYTDSVGAPPTTSFLHPTAANDLLQLQSSGYTVNVPQLSQAAPVQLKNFVAADPTNNTAVYNQAVAAIKATNGGQNPSADDIYSLLQQQGYTQ